MRVPARYTLNDVLSASVPSSRQDTRLPLPERTEMRPRSRSSISRPFSPWGGGEVGGVDDGGVDVGGCEVGGGEVGGVVVPPVHVTPLSANADGTGLVAVKAPLNPK